MADAERPEPRSGILYVDTSVLVKLLVREAESEAVEVELLRWGRLATSVVKEVELPRSVARAREERPDAVIDGSVVLQGVLASAAIVPLDADIVAKARDVSPVHVSTLDAIHIASALSLGDELAAVATYDHRMQDALAKLKIEVVAPEAVLQSDGDST
jgi:predicted nucleic acid-binding protein